MALAAVPAMIALVVSPLLAHPWTLGDHNWDQMHTQREVVVQTILRYHQFPFWDPFTCGGHPAWGALESDPIVVSPWLPVYLLAPLPIAIRVEIIVSAVFGAVGAWRLATRFTDSRAVQSLFTVVTVVNSRWALQIATGHTWHLLYALLPWILFAFDRAIDPGTSRRVAVRDVVVAGVCLSAMVYGDGIYPVPHTAFIVGLYAVLVARSTRSMRPLWTLVAFGAVAVGLSAPKLFPLFEGLARFPRIVKSDEAIWPNYIPAIFLWRAADRLGKADFIGGALWHEWGLYLGWPALVGLLFAIPHGVGPRVRALRWIGLLLFLFVVLGGVHPATPWRLLHLLPMFKSQHVPSRWLYPGMTVLACCGAAGADRWLQNAGKRRAGLEAMFGIAALVVAMDMGLVAREAVAESFVNPMPDAPAEVGHFHMVHRLGPQPNYASDLWGVRTLPAVLGNIGTLECDTDHEMHTMRRDPEGRAPRLGAFGANDPDYRGETYVVERASTATITSFAPDEVVVNVDRAEHGDHVVLNQNWDAGWSANGLPAVAWHNAVATVTTTAGAQSIVFRYRPRTLGVGLAAFALSLAGIGALLFSTRRRDAAPDAPARPRLDGEPAPPSGTRTARARMFVLPFLFLVLGCLSRDEPLKHVPDALPQPASPTAQVAASARVTDRVVADSGDVLSFVPLEHASLLFLWRGASVYVDPTSPAVDDPQLPKADLVLLTDAHYDHTDPFALSQVKKPGTVVVGPQPASAYASVDVVVSEGDRRSFSPGLQVTAVPLYGVARGPGPGALYHPRGAGVGYVLEFGGKRIYVSGDSECTPELRSLSDIDLAFVSLNVPYAMTPAEATGCVAAFRPRVVIPYAYRHADLAAIDRRAVGPGIDLRRREFYPRAALARATAYRAFSHGMWGWADDELDKAKQIDPAGESDWRVQWTRQWLREYERPWPF